MGLGLGLGVRIGFGFGFGLGRTSARTRLPESSARSPSCFHFGSDGLAMVMSYATW